MRPKSPIELALAYAQEYAEKVEESAGRVEAPFDVYVVWFSYVLGGWKALVSTTLPHSLYMEITHNVVENETYLDAYFKAENIKVQG